METEPGCKHQGFYLIPWARVQGAKTLGSEGCNPDTPSSPKQVLPTDSRPWTQCGDWNDEVEALQQHILRSTGISQTADFRTGNLETESFRTTLETAKP